MSTATILILLGLLFGALAGARGRHPMPVVRALIANPDKRPITTGLFMLRGMYNFIDPSADATVHYSFRYGETPFSWQTAGWSFGLASAIVTGAIYLGWLFFDITTIGDRSFLEKAAPGANEPRAQVWPWSLFVFWWDSRQNRTLSNANILQVLRTDLSP